MNLSLHADYACRMLMYLALQPNDRASIDQVAAVYGISANHLVKVVHRLGQLGFVETTRGRGGGVRLARPAEKISIGEVVRAMEPSFAIVECFDADRSTCPITGPCGLKSVLARAMTAFLAELDRMTLAEAVSRDAQLRKILSAPAG